MVGLGLVLPAALGINAVVAFVLPPGPGWGAGIALVGYLVQWSLLGWAYLRLQKLLDEGVKLREGLGLARDWIAAGWALFWRVAVTVLVVSLPSLVVGVLAGFADGTAGPAPTPLPDWAVKAQSVLSSLAVNGWLTVFLWTFPMIAVHQNRGWRVSQDEAWKLSRRTWYWGALLITEGLIWSLVGPAEGPAAAWHPFLLGSALTLFGAGQVLWLLSRRDRAAV